ncbi:PE-PPE domain-containing protein [Mycobacterium sp. ITM-2016-00316]|uniref:PE-PPE domain-containing protein n=1 Tax=Mycobacterium sp. ITM-2016-00316 TaxID=2099695 RepID=UPI001158A166|nr:PE-PPE domain-containing protein [Mycobacterium sp. ITM-2016-00316]WNG80154.1 PE-PPE domain-containing protein [Mycobacterium sp. ITM-2016-00316]
MLGPVRAAAALFCAAALVSGVGAHTAPVQTAAREVGLTANTYGIQPLLLGRGDAVTPVLSGRPCGQGQCTVIEHPADLSAGSIPTGIANLHQTLIEDQSTGITVFGLSQGGQVITGWLDIHGATAARQGDVTFVTVGSPESPGGFRDFFGFTDPSTPEDSGYAVITIVQQYDGWGNWPTRLGLLSALNATMGMFTIHNEYDEVDDAPYTEEGILEALAADPNGEVNRIWKSGGTYYVVNHTDLIPLAVPLTWIGLNGVARWVDDILRPIIDADYRLPAHGSGITVPAPTAEPEARTQRVSLSTEDTAETVVESLRAALPSGEVDTASPMASTEPVKVATASPMVSTESVKVATASPTDIASASLETPTEKRDAKKAERAAAEAEKQAEREAKKAERAAAEAEKQAERDAKKAERAAARAEKEAELDAKKADAPAADPGDAAE